MNIDCQLNQIRGLMKLLRVEDEDNSDSDNDAILPAVKTSVAAGPAGIKPMQCKNKSKKPSPYAKLEEDEGNTNSMQTTTWDQFEQEELENNLPQPEFKISYKQAVTTEDVYLGMNNKSPSTASCEDIVLEIKLPAETVGIEEMSVNVTEKEVHFESPRYKTKIPLPYTVDPNKGKAIYNNDHKILKLTLRMKRELDFVNF